MDRSPVVELGDGARKALFHEIRGCGRSRNLSAGKRLHLGLSYRGYDTDSQLGNALVEMYGKCGQLDSARRAFDQIAAKDSFSWNLMMRAYLDNKQLREVVEVYREWKREYEVHRAETNDYIFVTALTACGALGEDGVVDGRSIHRDIVAAAEGVESRIGERTVLATAVMHMYAKGGSVRAARKVFDLIQHKEAVTWGTIFTAYASKHGDAKQTLDLFRRMDLEGAKPNAFVYSAVLDACAKLGALAEGAALHSRIVNVGLGADTVVITAVITMYTRCGRMQEARAVFDELKIKDVVCWNSLIAGYAQHAGTQEALQMFYELNVESWEPNRSTLNIVLHACAHAGLVQQGRNYFISMIMDHGIAPGLVEYVRIVDLLGRAGWLDQAEELVETMPFQPDGVAWAALLAAYNTHGRVEGVEHAANELLKLEPHSNKALTFLNNIYAKTGRWDDLREVRRAMGWKEVPGHSYIEIKNRLHSFGIVDELHPHSEEIKIALVTLKQQIKSAGYVPVADEIVETMEEKVGAFGCHSEMAAIAFGLISTNPGTSLQIVKNLRVCFDCHAAVKFISKIVSRTITIRDEDCYHCFANGQCSCKDCW